MKNEELLNRFPGWQELFQTSRNGRSWGKENVRIWEIRFGLQVATFENGAYSNLVTDIRQPFSSLEGAINYAERNLLNKNRSTK